MNSAAATSLWIIAAWLVAAMAARAAPPIDPVSIDPVSNKPPAAQFDTLTVLPAGNPRDRVISASPFNREWGPAIAVNPKATSRVVVGFVRESMSGHSCFVRSSTDGGTSWAAPVRLPTSERDRCDSIDLAYAARGSRLFAAYDIYADSGGRIAIATSDDDGRTWRASPAFLPIPGPGCDAPMPKLATARDRAIVYLAAVWCVQSGYINDYRVVVSRSADAGNVWSAPRTLQSGRADPGSGVSLGAPRLAEGAGGALLVGWAFRLTQAPTGVTGIRIAYSRDFGATFGAVSTPVSTTDGNIQSFDLEVGFKGAAHLAYDQFWFDETRENMDIRYTWSARPPYATWSAPVTVSDETNQRLQGSPTLAVQACKGRTILHLAWSDSRLASPALNDVYDIFYARKKAISGAKWSKNVRVSDRSSSAFDPGFPPGGDMDLAVAGDTAIAAWPDRRNVAMYDRDLDVYVSQISHWHGLSLRPRAPHRPPVCCPDHRRIPCPQPSASAPTNNWMPLQEREIRRGLRDALARNLRDVFWPIKEPLKARVSRAPVSGIRLRYPHRGDHDG